MTNVTRLQRATVHPNPFGGGGRRSLQWTAYHDIRSRGARERGVKHFAITSLQSQKIWKRISHWNRSKVESKIETQRDERVDQIIPKDRRLATGADKSPDGSTTDAPTQVQSQRLRKLVNDLKLKKRKTSTLTEGGKYRNLF